MGADVARVSLATYAFVLLGGRSTLITRRLHLLPRSPRPSGLTFAVGSWGSSALSRTLDAVPDGASCPVDGFEYWWVIVASPEILVFMYFMITDPKTIPRGARPRVVFGASVGLASALLVAPMQTEFGAKVAVLSGLVLVCMVRPVLTVAAERGMPVPARLSPVVLGAVVPAPVVALVVAGLPAREPAVGAGIEAPGAGGATGGRGPGRCRACGDRVRRRPDGRG